MNKFIAFVQTLVYSVIAITTFGQDSRAVLFDADWRFKKDSLTGLENPTYKDDRWRNLNLPHDWSIEDLPGQLAGQVMGPFTKASVGKAATGYTEGGVGWYRKTFTLDKSYQGKQTYITFDGVYMDADVWINGHHLGNHPYGYTAFSYNLTDFLQPTDQPNVIAVRAKNLGKNSRWYAGAGIYRHVWLMAVNPVHTAINGTFVTTPSITPGAAQVLVESSVENMTAQPKTVEVRVDVLNPSGQVVASQKQSVMVATMSTRSSTQQLTVKMPVLWTLEKPILYSARVTLLSEGKMLDQTRTPFGIRSLEFNGQKGFLLNGNVVKIKGGCIHHDNGPLGAVALDRAEERKIELLKKAGYNAIRLSHNPSSSALLNACDRLGMLVVTDAFDMWEKEKLGVSNGYHRFFKEWWKKDIDAIMLRDRNHPSIIIWGIGNEIWEAADTSGHRIAKQLADEVRRLDPTRAVTEAMLYLPQQIKYKWEAFGPHLANLDVDGYNYFIGGPYDPMQRDSATTHRYETEHAQHPNKLYMSTESYPSAALENWNAAEKYSYVIGGFSWTAMDYIGEANIGGPSLVAQATKIPKGLMSLVFFFKPESWPVFNAHCGDLDLIGNRKAASYYQNVVWRNSPIELLVHRPIPEGMKEARSPWGFPDELKSWSWSGQEGKPMQVSVYTRAKRVRLELNGKTIAEQTVPEGSITATFDIPYQSGTLTAHGFDGEKEVGTSSLSTTGKPVAIRLVADRTTIKADQQDLSYVQVELVDQAGQVVPWDNDTEITYQLTGNASLAGVGNGSPVDLSSFQQAHKKVYEGRGLVILRASGQKGVATLTATARGMKAAKIAITTR
ncbi:sugar-binding domain-containing protein [Spirosoma foliorum]|uniref:Glycoside hydrolase family 2 protein n=1 Tax=Spirosoma foliorum TaxID=2710596 RepID=A0A7G5GNY9_9BACT|nr:sugar-binding domain-containing protein [Spirosoma foliorum]QMW00581.1 glycoside hydrolase family 2 protein [Spirosoma foliorum]